VIDGDALYEFNADTAITSLPKVAQEQLLKIVSGKPGTDMLKQVQAFFYQYREALMTTAEYAFPVGKGVTDLYTNRVGKTAQHEGNGSDVLNRLGIERCSYNPVDRTPILPGSSIKGAIRTALLDRENAGAALKQIEDNRAHKLRNENNQELQQRLFDYKMRDLHKDPMRLVSISDAKWASNDRIPGNEIRFAVNRKRRLGSEDRLQQSLAESGNLYQILECLGAMQPRTFTASLNLHLPHVAQSKHATRLPETDLQWTVHQIAQACNEFYRKIFDDEIQKMGQLGYLDETWQRLANRLQSDLNEKLDSHQAFLLRIGRHSGADSVTLHGARNNAIKIMAQELNNNELQAFKDAKEAARKDRYLNELKEVVIDDENTLYLPDKLKNVQLQGRNRLVTYESAPKTWWLAAGDTDSKGRMMPFGWVLVEIDADESQPLQAQADMKQFNLHRQQWFVQQQQHKQQLQERFAREQEAERQRLDAAEAVRRQLEEQKRLEAEKQAAEAAAREAALAQLNPIEREIAEFSSALDALKAIESGQWSNEEQQQAAQFLKTRMQQEKIWKEAATTKNPDKDKDFKRTQTVMKFL
jgi:CRISPR-associated protein Csm5